MKILVTGGAGDVGSAVVSHLVGRGHQVRVFDRQIGRVFPGAEYVEGDIAHFDALREAVRGQEAIAHLAGIRSPSGGPGQEIFRINAAGTFNVYQAAAAEGIGRVACASSICALGFLFGRKDFEIQYFPVDEEHSPFTTDPYSFSKQILEEIADYFWRREGISSACLRLTAVPDLSQKTLARIQNSILHIRQDLEELAALPEAEREIRLRRFMHHIEVARTSGALGSPLNEWSRLCPGLSDWEVNAIIWRNHFWTLVHPQDAAKAFERGLLASFQGSYPLYINDGRNFAGVESELLARFFFPGVKARKRPLLGSEALVSIEKARELIGFEPEHQFT